MFELGLAKMKDIVLLYDLVSYRFSSNPGMVEMSEFLYTYFVLWVVCCFVLYDTYWIGYWRDAMNDCCCLRMQVGASYSCLWD